VFLRFGLWKSGIFDPIISVEATGLVTNLQIEEAWRVSEFVGLRTRLKPGMEEAYDAAHAAVWPELVAAQSEAGIARWLIFRDGLDIFHSIECEDYERAIAELARLPLNQRWQAEMAPYTEVAHDYSAASADRLRLIFNAP
jgi:L-rhamnose mutarotase